jgi:hypothetical protein
MCFNSFYSICLHYFSFLKEMNEIRSKWCIGIHVKYRYYCQNLEELDFSGQIFEKFSSIKFHEDPSRGSRVVAWTRTRTNGQTDRHDETNRCLHNFVKAPKTNLCTYHFHSCSFCPLSPFYIP